jgi:hypothetical protein
MANPSIVERIAGVNATAILNNTVVPGITEMQVVEDAINRARTVMTIYGLVELPGLTIWKDFVTKAVADFKTNVANNQVVNFTSRVTANDIALDDLTRPAVYSGYTSFRQTGLTTGQYVPILTQTSGTAVKNVLLHERYVITDVIEWDPTAGIEGLIIIADGDNNSQPLSIGSEIRSESSMRVAPLDFPQVADVSLNVAARLVQGSDTELVPLGVRIYTGDQVRLL